MKDNRWFVFILLLSCFGIPALAQQIPELPFQKFTLSNGFQVILHEDHSTPTVSVNIWYHVGSKNEKPGRTGFAHLFEHLMFEGSENVPEGMFDKWLEAAGGDNNGSTTEDRTNYWENVPSNALELALFLESDRMANLLAAVDQKKLDIQRDVVKNERRQGVDNQPYGLVEEISLEALYPDDHPYSWPVIGSMADLSAASLEDVQNFFKQYYTPNNASLSIAGDIEPKKTLELVKKYFGSIPPGPPVARFEKWVPQMDGVRRVDLKDRVSLGRVYMYWHSPALFEPGEAELDLLADILASGKDSRLYRSLVYERQIAQNVRAYQASREIAGTFVIVVTAKPKVSLATLEQAVDTELRKLLNEPPTDQEVATALNSWEAGFLRRLQSIGGFGGKADRLNYYNVFAGDPGFIKQDFQRYRNVTPQSIFAAAKNYLQLDNRVILRVEPLGDLIPESGIPVDRSQRPKSGKEPEVHLPTFTRHRLDNGLEVLIVEHHELPLVQMQLLVHTGWTADVPGKWGLSSLTSDLQDEGTPTRSALEISRAARAIGARLSTSSSFDGSSVSLNTLKRELDPALELFADVILHPTFPEAELTRKKKEYQARILQENRRPFTVAFKTFLKTLYGPEHPYGQPYTGTGTPESLQRITRKDLMEFYKRYFRPNNATLIVVGDVTPAELLPKVRKAFYGWEKADVPKVSVPSVKPLTRNRMVLVNKPGAAQSVIVIGNLSTTRNTPDYYAIEVMNTILGGKFTSRLNQNLREEKGYTYGAGSFFMWNKNIAPFLAYAQVQSEVTKESLQEFVREFHGMSGEKPVTEQELEETKRYIVLRYPRGFETISQIAGKLNELITYQLPDDVFDRYVPGIQKVDAGQVVKMAKRFVDPERMLFVIVGDLQKIEAGVRSLALGEVVVAE